MEIVLIVGIAVNAELTVEEVTLLTIGRETGTQGIYGSIETFGNLEMLGTPGT